MGRPLDVVFEGGGARGLVQNGAVEAIEAAGYELRRVVGTSAGAITAALSACGHSGADLRRISFERGPDGRSRMTSFLSEPAPTGTAATGGGLAFLDHVLHAALNRVPGAAHVHAFVEDGGWYAADGFLDWLTEHVVAKTGDPDISFGGLFTHTGRHLSVVVTDTTSGTERVLNHLTAPDCPVRWGVRMSMSIPLIWPEVRWLPAWGTYRGEDLTDHTFVDGGIASNFGLNLLIGGDDVAPYMGPPPPEADVMGLWIDLTAPVPGAPARLARAPAHHNRVIERLERLLDAMMTGNDLLVVEAHRGLVCRLPAAGYGVTEFDMPTERVAALVDAGSAAAARWLASRPSAG